MARGKDLTGQRFGKLTVVRKTEERREGYVVWHCRCDCGRELDVDTKRLSRGTVRDCGCVPKEDARNGCVAEDLTGKIFGHLTVIERTENRKGRTCWLCRCECGNLKAVTAHDLKAGKVKSCGCGNFAGNRIRIDLSGKRFGRLTALFPTEKRDRKGSVYWHCRCDCGNETDVTEKRTRPRQLPGAAGASRARTRKISPSSSIWWTGPVWKCWKRENTAAIIPSGFRGVYQLKNRKYRVDIGFKGKRFYIGCFEDYDDAVRARLEAEKMIHGGFLTAYHDWQEKEKKDPLWGKEHPLVFEVYKENGRLTVKSEV